MRTLARLLEVQVLAERSVRLCGSDPSPELLLEVITLDALDEPFDVDVLDIGVTLFSDRPDVLLELLHQHLLWYRLGGPLEPGLGELPDLECVLTEGLDVLVLQAVRDELA